MTTFTEAPHPGEFIISEAEGARSRDAIIIAISQTLKAGHVLGQTNGTVAVAAAVPGTGNTGNGAVTLNATPYGTGVIPGTYKAVFVEPTTNLGTFVVEDPNGVILGKGVVGTEYTGQIVFTIADGATDFVAGDSFSFAVTMTGRQWGEFDPAATDGRQVAAGILFGAVTTGGSATGKGVAITRAAEVNLSKLTFKTGMSAPNKAAGLATLLTQGIVAR